MRLGSTVVAMAHFGGEGGIEIPATALTRADGAPAVWVVDPTNSTVSLRGIGIDRFSPSAVRVADGLQVGDIVVLFAGQEIARVPLVALQDVGEGSLWQRARDTVLGWF